MSTEIWEEESKQGRSCKKLRFGKARQLCSFLECLFFLSRFTTWRGEKSEKIWGEGALCSGLGPQTCLPAPIQHNNKWSVAAKDTWLASYLASLLGLPATTRSWIQSLPSSNIYTHQLPCIQPLFSLSFCLRFDANIMACTWASIDRVSLPFKMLASLSSSSHYLLSRPC
jgi:hypothetical protein